MAVIEEEYFDKYTSKCECDLCGDETEVLFEKPNSAIVRGQKVIFTRPKPLYVCLDCLQMEAENF